MPTPMPPAVPVRTHLVRDAQRTPPDPNACRDGKNTGATVERVGTESKRFVAGDLSRGNLHSRLQ